MPIFRFAIAQVNPIVGDFVGNLELIKTACNQASSSGADLVVFGEMVISGYPIEDLAKNESFLKDSAESLANLAAWLEANHPNLDVLVGLPLADKNEQSWSVATNSAVLIRAGRVAGKYDKHHLPNYSVFDEYRIFNSGSDYFSFEVKGHRIGVVICEDIWQEGGPVGHTKAEGIELLCVLNGSPFEISKADTRVQLVSNIAKKYNCAVAYSNLVGGQDDLVFDGDSFVVSANGSLVARGKQFESDLLLFDFVSANHISAITSQSVEPADELWQIWHALRLGLADYVAKNSFKSVILGLSGGIDSALCAALAVDALGKERVFGVAMPSEYSSQHSLDDAADLARRLDIDYRIEPIADLVEPFDKQLGLSGLAAENIQARVRGSLLMALSNSEGHLVLTTGNKTEVSVGYSTIYGDSVGGFAPIKDVPKTLVWQLAKWRNRIARELSEIEPIPENSISKPPSAELRPGQVDQDTLPDYELLDALLELYVGQRKSVSEIVDLGFEPELVSKISRLVDSAEWKRRQSAIGTKITAIAFGRDRRLPITNRYR